MRISLAVALAVLSLHGAPLHAAPPAPPTVSIEQALKMAQDYLKEHGLADRVTISSLALQPATLTSREIYWYAKWSPEVVVESKTETGLRINMDGSIVRFTSGNGPGGSTGRADTPGVRRFGARDLR